jgi:hypothetical protein
MNLDHATIEASARFQTAANRLPTLFSMEETAYELLALLDDDPDNAELEAQLVLIDQMLIEKTESYCSVIRSLEAMASARKVEADRLRDRAQAAQRQADWLKQRLMVHMKTAGRDRVEMSRFTLSIRQNPVSCVVLEELMVPAEFKRTVVTTTVDKNAIKAWVKETGEVVPGIELVRTESLSIR